MGKMQPDITLHELRRHIRDAYWKKTKPKKGQPENLLWEKLRRRVARRGLQTKAGEVLLKIPKLRQQTFETAIIERYRRRESSVAITV